MSEEIKVIEEGTPQVLAEEPKATVLDCFGHTTQEISDRYNGDLQGGLYYYLIDEKLMRDYCTDVGTARKTVLVPPTEAVVSVSYSPYLTRDDFTVSEIQFDKARFPVKGLTDNDSGTNVVGTVVRINEVKVAETGRPQTDKKIGEFKCFNPAKSIGGARNWRNEGKLHLFPYQYGMMYDGVSNPYEFKYELLTGNTQTVRAHLTYNNTGTYDYYISGYKGDFKGVVESCINQTASQLPVVSNAYTNFMAQNQAQMSAMKSNGAVGMISGAMQGALGGALTGAAVGGINGAVAGPMGVLAGSIVGAGSGILSGHAQISQAYAQERDLTTTPGVLGNMGTDFLFKRERMDIPQLTLYRYSILESQLQRLGDFFAMYGYKQNKIMRPNTRNRYYYNYIKTSGANLRSNGKIPKEHFEEIQSILDNGTTIWHIARPGVDVGDYSKDNYEV